MSKDLELIEQLKQTKGSVKHNEARTGTGPKLPEEGKTWARLVGYIELGTHPQEYQGSATDPAMEVQLVFECLSKNNIDEIEVDGKKKKVGRVLRPFPMKMSMHVKSAFYKLFKKMDYDRGLEHMYHMINDVFRIEIEHAESKAGKKYAKMVEISSPLVEQTDEDGDVIGHTDMSEKVPPATRSLQAFLIENPTFEQWESLHIEGTYTKKTKDESGNEIEEEVSKNFIQEKIMSALDWEGSAMQTLLLDLGDGEADEEEPKKKAPEKKAAKKKVDPAPVADSEDDLLEELGL